MSKWTIDGGIAIEAYQAVVAHDGSLVFLDDDQTILFAVAAAHWEAVSKIDD